MQCDTSDLLLAFVFFFFMQNIIVILSYNECRNTKQRGECNKNQHNAKDQTEAN